MKEFSFSPVLDSVWHPAGGQLYRPCLSPEIPRPFLSRYGHQGRYPGAMQTAHSPTGYCINSIWQPMFNFGIPDTTLNHEKAMSRIFGGCAAALLNIDQRHEREDKGLSALTGGGLADADLLRQR
jgi:hypothetical protein